MGLDHQRGEAQPGEHRAAIDQGDTERQRGGDEQAVLAEPEHPNGEREGTDHHREGGEAGASQRRSAARNRARPAASKAMNAAR